MEFTVTFLSALFANAAFWSAATLNCVIDWLAQTRHGKRFAAAKLQPDRYITKSEMFDVLGLAFLNMAILGPFLCAPLFEFVWEFLHGDNRLEAGKDPWDWHREVIRIPIDMFLNEVSFYAAHYFLHKPFWYQHVHKVHHRFKAPTAMAAAYAHPLEFIFGNVLCIGLGPILTNAHPYTAYFWFSAAILSTCKGHSGYDILNASTHDLHHQHTNWNFGVLHFGDYFMGTSIPASMKGQRKSGKPARQMQ